MRVADIQAVLPPGHTYGGADGWLRAESGFAAGRNAGFPDAAIGTSAGAADAVAGASAGATTHVAPRNRGRAGVFALAAAALCLFAALMAGFALMPSQAFAAGQSTQNRQLLYSAVNPDEKGSISLEMRTVDGSPVSGGQLALYKVGELKAVSGGYEWAYTDAFKSCSDSLTADRIQNADTAYIGKLEAIVRRANTTDTQTIRSDGSVSFDNLLVGVYLIVQTKAASGYESTNSFLVTIPMEENGQFNYNVNATPKVGSVAPGSSSSSSSSSGSTVSSGVPGGNTPGTPGGNVPGGTLPQTGQLWWPVALLSVAGVACIVAGVASNRRRRNRMHEA
jgi:hypothetical protein